MKTIVMCIAHDRDAATSPPGQATVLRRSRTLNPFKSRAFAAAAAGFADIASAHSIKSTRQAPAAHAASLQPQVPIRVRVITEERAHHEWWSSESLRAVTGLVSFEMASA